MTRRSGGPAMRSRSGIGLLWFVLGCAPHSRIVDHDVLEGELDNPPPPEEPGEPPPFADASGLPDDHCERLARADEPLPIDPDGDHGGALMTTHRGQYVGLPLADTTFATTVTGTIAATTVTQTFV